MSANPAVADFINSIHAMEAGKKSDGETGSEE
jgi:hypothetical protein